MVDLNVIKLSKVLEIDIQSVEKLMDIITLSDMAGMITALAHGNNDEVKSIYEKYIDQLIDSPDPLEIKNYYDEQLELIGDVDSALASTADFFGIKGEDVQAAIKAPAVESLEIYDNRVIEAVKEVENLIAGKSSRKIISELNTWQRRQFFGLIPEPVAKVIKGVLDITPLGLIKKQAELSGVAEISITESSMTFNDMIETILAHELKGINLEQTSKLEFSEKLQESAIEIEVDSIISDVQSKLIKSITDKKF